MSSALTLRVVFDDTSVTETLDVLPRDGALFQLIDEPLFAESAVHAGDTVELKYMADGRYRFVRVVTSSSARHHTWIVPQFFIESPEYQRFCGSVASVGGSTERAMGGVLVVHLPHDAPLDVDAELARWLECAEAVRRSAG